MALVAMALRAWALHSVIAAHDTDSVGVQLRIAAQGVKLISVLVRELYLHFGSSYSWRK